MFEPPSLPSAGWYPDPDLPGQQRYWTGSAWGNRLSSPQPFHEHTPAVGAWLGHSFTQSLSRWRAIAVIALLTAAPASVLFALAARYGLNNLAIRNEELVGWSNDRIPALVALGLLAAILTIVGSVAISVLMLRTEDGEQPGASFGDEARLAVQAIGGTVRILPRLIGWAIAFMAVGVVVMLALVVLALATGGAALLLIIVLFPVGVYFLVKLAFFVQAIIDGPGNPYPRSASAVSGRWWPVFGRLLLIGLVTSIISAMIQSSGSAASGNGFGASFNQNTIETDRDGRIIDVELSELYPIDVWSVLVGTVATLAIAVLATAVAAAGLAALYRSRVTAS